MQEKRAKLIELSNEAKALRNEKVKTAKNAEEAVFWQTRTINYMLLNHIYPNAGQRFETFQHWKEEGATIRKGAKATIIWGQPRQAFAKKGEQEQPTQPDQPAQQDGDMEADQYEFFPICFLFSEKDVFFPNAEPESVTADAKSPPRRVAHLGD